MTYTIESHIQTVDRELGDAHDEPDTGKPPCIFCRREIPCECNNSVWDLDPVCMCTCGRCRYEIT